MSALSIEAVGLTKHYNSFIALSDLNLSLSGSKCVGFLGPNGAGKTTTLKIFADMIRPTKGKALINGIDVRENKKEALAGCGILVETPEIYPSLTVREALSMLAEIRGIPGSRKKEMIFEAISEVKMEEWLDKKVGKLSKGMKQRVNIAAALLAEPEIMLLDEPSTGLDPRGMAEVREIVKGLKRKSRLIFMSSHLLSEVAEVCDEVAIIDHGRLLMYDTIENATAGLSGSGDITIAEVDFSKPLGEPLLKSISHIEGVVEAAPLNHKRLALKFRGGVEAQERILGEIAAMKSGMISFKPSSSALEDAYLRLVKDTV